MQRDIRCGQREDSDTAGRVKPRYSSPPRLAWSKLSNQQLQQRLGSGLSDLL